MLQNGRGYVPLSSVPEILNKLLAKPVQLHAAARRLFVGDVPIRFSLELDKSTPPKLSGELPQPGESLRLPLSRAACASPSAASL